MFKRCTRKFVAGYRRALKLYPVESRFYLCLIALGCIGLLLQKDTLLAGLTYGAFWSSFMVSLMCFCHDDLFGTPD
jgi:hypothetical protein